MVYHLQQERYGHELANIPLCPRKSVEFPGDTETKMKVNYLPDESHGGRNGQTFVVGQDHGAAVVQDRVQQLHLVRVTLKHRG